jgi:hypothetical protein
MVFGLAAMVFAVLGVMIVPVGIYAAIRVVNRMLGPSASEAPMTPAIEHRLRRMEEAIDAMSQQIERMRMSDRYVSEGADDMPLLPPSDDPQTFS